MKGLLAEVSCALGKGGEIDEELMDLVSSEKWGLDFPKPMVSENPEFEAAVRALVGIEGVCGECRMCGEGDRDEDFHCDLKISGEHEDNETTVVHPQDKACRHFRVLPLRELL